MCNLFIKTQYIFYFYQRFLKCKQISVGRCNCSLVKSLLLYGIPKFSDGSKSQCGNNQDRFGCGALTSGFLQGRLQVQHLFCLCRIVAVILFPSRWFYFPFPDWEDTPGKGQDLQEHGRTGVKLCLNLENIKIKYK